MTAWALTDSPKATRLTAVDSHGTGAFSTGERGLLLERVAPRTWHPRCLNGPEESRRDLLDLSFTGGARVWFCGAEGALGYYDRVTEQVRSVTAPYDITSRFRSLAVRGVRGSESVHVADDCGRVLRVVVEDGRCSTRGVAVPADDSAFTDIVHAGGALYAADTAGRVHYSEAGREWQSRRLAPVALRSLGWSPALGLVAVDDAGTVFRNAAPYREGQVARATPELESPRAVTATGQRIVAAGGRRHERRVGGSSELLTLVGSRAVRGRPGTDEPLYGVELLENGTVLAVGSAGTIAEGKP